MKTLVELLTDNENRWNLQVIQHTLALLSHLPIRIWDAKKQVEDTAIDEQEKEYIKTLVEQGNAPELSQVAPEIANFYSKRANSRWLTISRTGHQLNEILRQYKSWRAWEHRLIRWLTESSKVSESDKSHFFSQNMEIHVRPLFFNDSERLFLVVGPMFVYPIGSGLDRDFHWDVKNFIGRVIKRLGPFENVSEHEESDLILAGKSAGWIYTECLNNEASMLSKALWSLFAAKLHDNFGGIKLTNSALHLLGTICLLMQKELSPKKGSINLPEWIEQIMFRIDRSKNLCLFARQKGESWELEVGSKEGAVDSRVELTISDSNENRNKEKNKIEIEIKKILGEYGQSFAYQFNGYTGSRVKDLSAWMDNQFGVVSVELGESDAEASKNYSSLANKIGTLFIADSVSIYSYNSVERKLALLSAEPINHRSEEDRRNLTAIEKDVLDQVMEQPDKRKLDISYRSLESGAPEFCQSWTPKNIGGDAIPKDQPLLNPKIEGVDFKVRSAIAVPMKIHGHTFGILKLQGYSHFQFRREIVNFVEQVANIIAPYIYQQDLLSRLSTLSDKILDIDNPNNKETLQQICRDFAQIFLADASSMFFPIGKEFEYKPGVKVLPLEFKASCNRPLLDESLEEDKKPYRIEDPSPVTDALLYQDKKYNVYYIPDWAEDHKEWEKAEGNPYRKETVDNYHYIVVIPFKHEIDSQVDWSTDEESADLAALSLYYKVDVRDPKSKPPSEMWEHTAKFLSNHIAVLLRETEKRHRIDDRIHRLLRHELKHLVNNVTEKAKAIFDSVKKQELQDQKLKEKMERLSSQLHISRVLLNRIMGLFKDENWSKFKKFMRTCNAPDPVLFLMSKDGAIDLEADSENVTWSEFLEEMCSIYDPYIMEYNSPQQGPSEIKGDFEDSIVNQGIRIHKFGLQIVMQKLLENAVRYCLANTEVTVSLKQEGQAFVIRVINKGLCLENAAARRRIYDWGEIGANVAKDQEGTGIGLYIAKAICDFLEIELYDDINEFDPDRTGKIGQYEFVLVFPFSKYQPIEEQKNEQQ